MSAQTSDLTINARSAAEIVGTFIAGIMTMAGCASDLPRVYGLPGCSPRQETPWTPPNHAVDEQLTLQREKKTVPLPGILTGVNKLSLAEIVDIALQSNNQTRAAWAQARAAAANYGSKLGSYLPQVNGLVAGSRQKSAVFGQRTPSAPHSEYSANGSLTWLLFDFGGRSASVEEEREILFAADWTHTAVIQNVILEVELAYYNYAATKSRIDAQQAAVDEAKTNLSAANDRHSAGLATIADVLQAQTGLSQALLTLGAEEGQLMTTRGALATAMGLPADLNVDIDLPVGDAPVAEARKTVAEYLDLALRERPDLAVARAQALGAAAHVKSVRSQMLPSLSASGAIGKVYFDSLSGGSFTYSAGLGLTIPIFSGFSRHYDLLAARAEADAARAVAQNTEDNVRLQVWTSYYNLETAGQMVHTSDDLLKSASQNYDVALGRYKAGVGSILDLLTAQAALQNGRAQRVAARADWWQAVAQLAHDTGALTIASPAETKENGKSTDRKNP